MERTGPDAKPLDVQLNGERFASGPSVASSPRVLVAEDDPQLRKLIVRLLTFEGYLVTEASDALAMLEAVKGGREYCDDTFDLIVTDVRMPGLSGLDALARLRESGCHAPAIVVSSMPRDLIQGQVQELNAMFVPKPFALDNLRKLARLAIWGQVSDGT